MRFSLVIHYRSDHRQDRSGDPELINFSVDCYAYNIYNKQYSISTAGEQMVLVEKGSLKQILQGKDHSALTLEPLL